MRTTDKDDFKLSPSGDGEDFENPFNIEKPEWVDGFKFPSSHRHGF